MNKFAELLDRLAYEPGRNNKLRLIADFLRTTPDPERGFALAALTGALSFPACQGRRDPRADRGAHRSGAVRAQLRLRRRSVGDGGADVAGRSSQAPERRGQSLSEVIETLSTLGKSQLPAQLARWLDGLDETGRWALLKLVTGGLRIGVSARLAKTAAASLGGKEPNEIEMLWPGLAPPYAELFALAGGPRRHAGVARSGAVSPGHARARDRGNRLYRARSERVHRRMEVGRHPRPGGYWLGRGRHCRDAALFADRRGHFQELSRSGASAGGGPARSTASF
jgi:hypothetical protein